jgi:hypothetical protein
MKKKAHAQANAPTLDSNLNVIAIYQQATEPWLAARIRRTVK